MGALFWKPKQSMMMRGIDSMSSSHTRDTISTALPTKIYRRISEVKEKYETWIMNPKTRGTLLHVRFEYGPHGLKAISMK